jgi:hypothetical protein
MARTLREKASITALTKTGRTIPFSRVKPIIQT